MGVGGCVQGDTCPLSLAGLPVLALRRRAWVAASTAHNATGSQGFAACIERATIRLPWHRVAARWPPILPWPPIHSASPAHSALTTHVLRGGKHHRRVNASTRSTHHTANRFSASTPGTAASSLHRPCIQLLAPSIPSILLLQRSSFPAPRSRTRPLAPNHP